MSDSIPSTGFSTVEMLIALAVSSMVLSAVVMLAFGNQFLAEDTGATIEALSFASGMLAQEQAFSRKDFNLVVPYSSSVTSGTRTYVKTILVEAQSDNVTKKVTAKVSWVGGHANTEAVTLTTLVTNFENASNADTCSSVPVGNWVQPRLVNTTQNFAQLVGDSAGVYTLTGVKAYKGLLYITANNSSVNKETFFIFDSTTSNPTLLSKIDNDLSVNSGLAGVALAQTESGLYAFVASASSFTRGQLQVIDISTAASPRVVATYKVPIAVVPTAGVGNAIFYKSGYVYLGLTKTSTGGDEFNIIDVHDPLHPTWVSGYQLGNDVNALMVGGSYVYLASPNTQNILALNISSPTTPVMAGSFTPLGGSNGKSLALVGDTLYLGRTFGTNEFYLVSAAKPSQLSLLGTKDIGTGTNTTVRSLLIRNSFAYLLTNTQLVIYSIATSSMITTYSNPLTLVSSSIGAALGCEGNTLYIVSNDSTGHGFLSVIQPGL